MPHFATDCSSNILSGGSESKILKAVLDVNDASDGTMLFVKEEIKVRVNAHKGLDIRGKKANFIHVFGYILEEIRKS
ncbi:MAG: hypothetical protein ABI325_05045 [Ginsengibacter sp.]